jgi:hypothetical protein
MAEPPSVVEFFSRVLPWHSPETPGFCSIVWRNPKWERGFDGKPYARLKDFMAGRDWLVAHPSVATDIWFHTGQELTAPDGKTVRTRPNTALMKSIFLDIDVKEGGYDSIPEALDALTAFCKTVQIPLPSAIVASGSGLQPYWISDRPLSVSEWQPYAEGMRALTVKHGLKCDAGVTVDAARVLRVPSTINNKTDPGRPVKLLGLAKEDINFEKQLAHIRGVIHPSVRAPVHGREKHNWVAALEAEAPDAELKATQPLATAPESPPIDITPVIKECPFFRHTFGTGGRDADQGLWMLTVLASTFVNGGPKIAHALSRGHKTYSPADTDAMYGRKEREKEERSLGWPSCSTFEQYGSKQCGGCPYKGKIKSPLNLHLTPPPPPPPPPDAPPPPPVDGRVLFVPAKPYFLSDDGFISGVVTDKSSGKARQVKARLFRQKIYDARTERGVGVYFTVEEDLGNFQEVLIYKKDLGAKTAKTLGDASILYETQYTGEVTKFMTSLMEKVWKEAAAEKVLPYGWAWGNGEIIGWAYGGRLYKKDGTLGLTGRADPGLADLYTPCGTDAPWFAALKLVTDQHRPALEVIVAASFGAPLLTFTGAPSGCIAGVSDTSSNKTTACNVGLGVWGNPKLTKIASTASSLGTQKRMAELKDLATFNDDISTTKDGLTAVTSLIRALFEGAQGDKLTQAGDMRARGQWQSILTITSNKSVFEHFAVLSPDNRAGLMRIFEFKVPDAVDGVTPGRIKTHDADIAQQLLEHNYGRVGERYSQELAKVEFLREFVHEMEDELSVAVGAKNEERFWISTITCIMCGAMLANRLGAEFHIDEIYKFLIQAYSDARGRVVEKAVGTSSYDNVTNALTAFFKEYPDNVAYTERLPRRGGDKSYDHVRFIAGSDPSRAIHVNWVVEARLCRISKRTLGKFLQENDYSTDAILDGLKEHYGLVKPYPQADLVAGIKGYDGSGREFLIVLPVASGSWMEENLYKHSPTRSALSVVRNDAAPGETDVKPA